MTEYREITDPRLQSRVRTRYSREIAALETLGFRPFIYKCERLGPFSALLQLPIVFMMRRAKEVLVFPFPLRLGAGYVLMVHNEPFCIADCMGMGVKFYTRFSDKSLLISSTLESHRAFQEIILQDSNVQVIRTVPCHTPEQAWLSHKGRTQEMEAAGKVACNTASFADYVEISRQEDLDLQAKRT
jgi:hypothetical protein